MLSSHLAMQCKGHLECALHTMSYLSKKHNSRLVFDPTYPDIFWDAIKHHDWEEFYGPMTEMISPNVPKSLGKKVDIQMFVDSNHASNKSNHRSCIKFMIIINMTLIVWFSKHQPILESSVFSAEFVMMKNRVKTLRGLRYKLWMMGVPISGPLLMHGSNMSVIHNTQ